VKITPPEPQLPLVSGGYLIMSFYQLGAVELKHFNIRTCGIHKFCLIHSCFQAGTIIHL
jgi:hypothetical protein